MYLVINDTHIGDRHSDKNLDKLYRLLEYHSQYPEVELILNGDIVDFSKNPRMDSRHFIFFRLLNKFASVYYILGNHDPAADEVAARVLHLKVHPGLTLQSGNKQIAICHGHQFDWTVTYFPTFLKWLTRLNAWIDDKTHLDLQRLVHKGPYVQNCLIPREVKKACNTVQDKADILICGHTHKLEISQHNNLMYYNTGSWVNSTCAYLTIFDGSIEIARI
jgi:UDP-2,3-diacylglucosamine pyrophosphatase LpxH